ncbi:MAG: hypothetical protein KGL39_30890 [Patescibacteria group bacterium]|nr:hypothetical protein [Patescibacteria group bacterium]
MIDPSISSDRVNEIINHPSIYPWICGPLTGPIDISPYLKSGDYTALFGEYGGFLFFRVKDGIYDAHSAVLPNGRGKWALRMAREALKIMFDKDAAEIMMAAPNGNLAVLSLIRRLKAKFRGSIDNGWWMDGHPVDADIYSLTKMDWEKCQ